MTTIRVFVNASPVDVDPGATALECVRRWRGEEGDAIAEGRRTITDSRGLPIPADSPAQAGSIFRTVANRAASPRD
jgi:hypothetical protein